MAHADAGMLQWNLHDNSIDIHTLLVTYSILSLIMSLLHEMWLVV